MSSTFKPVEALTYAKEYLKNMPLERVGASILDDVHKIMWMAAPWRWTLGSMPVVTLLSNTQDYTVSVPGDFLFLQRAYLTGGSDAPRELKIDPVLPTTVTLVGQSGRVALNGTTLRLSPKPGTQPSAAPVIISLYKKTAPTITVSNMFTAGTQVFDDEWYWVYREGVLWKAYLWGDDARAGSVQFADGKVQYSGQRANFEAALNFMRQNEKLPEIGTELK